MTNRFLRKSAVSCENLRFPVVFCENATTQNLVVKFDGEIRGGVLVENASDDFPQQKKSFQTSPEVRHQFRQKLRQLHSGNRWCLKIGGVAKGYSLSWLAKLQGDKKHLNESCQKVGRVIAQACFSRGAS